MPDVSAAEKRRLKLKDLVQSEGYDSLEELLEACVADSVSPAICMNDGCSYTAPMEGDQDRGWCEECGTGSMKSALVLAGLI